MCNCLLWQTKVHVIITKLIFQGVPTRSLPWTLDSVLVWFMEISITGGTHPAERLQKMEAAWEFPKSVFRKVSKNLLQCTLLATKIHHDPLPLLIFQPS